MNNYIDCISYDITWYGHSAVTWYNMEPLLKYCQDNTPPETEIRN